MTGFTDDTDFVRAKAQELRKQVWNTYSDRNLDSHQALTAATLEFLGLELFKAPKESPILRNSLSVLDRGNIIVDSSLEAAMSDYCILHEVGHFVLHASQNKECDTESVTFLLQPTANDIEFGLGYGPRMRMEQEANRFAIEYLIPLDEVWIDTKDSIDSVRDTLGRLYEQSSINSGLPEGFVISQLTDAVLLPKPGETDPEADNTTDEQASPPIDLDPSQKEAASISNGPFLLSAGPGTGKTKTLISRIIYLLEKRNDPSKILALTFSRKATQEIKERLIQFNPEIAQKVTVMSFHGFALELLRTFHAVAGLSQDPKILSLTEIIDFLEENYNSFEFKELLDLRDPLSTLKQIQERFISKAQDELLTPEDIELDLEKRKTLLQDQSDAEAPTTSEETRKAISDINRLQEANRAYKAYFKYLNDSQLLDYGEMIFRAVRLLRDNPDVLTEVRRRYKHILVDEFQDVNRASGILVKLIAADGEGLWAVGDSRQSIYRWRGASPENVTEFSTDYPNAVFGNLKRNYRSGKEIVEVFSRFASSMNTQSPGDFEPWAAVSDAPSTVRLFSYEFQNHEHIGIAEKIKLNVGDGKKYSHHSILSKSNNELSKVSRVLEAEGIPILFLGDVLERREVCDLLCLLDLRVSDTANGLFRVKDFPEFSLSDQDVKLIIKHVRRAGLGFQKFLTETSVPDDISDQGRESIARLREFFERNPQDLSAHHFIGRTLFKEGIILSSILSSFDPVRSPQTLLALYQFVNLARSVESRLKEKSSEDQITEFFKFLRKMAILKEDKSLSVIPESINKSDSVKLLTVHKSKGLEYETVFIPNLKKNAFKNPNTKIQVPDLPHISEKRRDSEAEEVECLFFVAMSRAKEELVLSRPRKSSIGQNSKPADLISGLSLAEEQVDAVKFPPTTTNEISKQRFDEKINFSQYELRIYRECPRKYQYEIMMGAGRETPIKSPYTNYKSFLKRVIKEYKKTARNTEDMKLEIGLELFELLWREDGLDSLPNAPIFKELGREAVTNFFEYISNHKGVISTEPLFYQHELGQISLSPDLLIKNTAEIRILAIYHKTTPKPKDISQDLYDSTILAHSVLRSDNPELDIKIDHLYLDSGEACQVELGKKKESNSLDAMERAIQGIKSGNFPTIYNDRECPRCPFYFPCSK